MVNQSDLDLPILAGLFSYFGPLLAYCLCSHLVLAKLVITWNIARLGIGFMNL